MVTKRRLTCRLACPFFGLTSKTRPDELFLEEIFYTMYIFQGESYNSAMDIPVVYRKYFINRWNKQKELENKASSKKPDVNEPLTQAQKQKYMKK